MKIINSKKIYCFSQTEINILSELINDIKKEGLSNTYETIGHVIEDITLKESVQFFDYTTFDNFTIKTEK